MVVPDFCEAAERGDPAVGRFFDGARVTVVACHARAVKWLARRAGWGYDDAAVRVLNMRTDGAESILAALGLDPSAGPARAEGGDAGAGAGWVPWYPVIDRDRCVNCRQCLSFCPFGVYSLSDTDEVRVTAPRNCKNNCPACARICPEAAIIFPKAPDAPINGAPVRPEDLRDRGADALKSKLAGASNLHELLAARRMRAACVRKSSREAGEPPP